MRLSWPLIGRTQQIHAIEAAITASAPGILICGAQGVGKSRIAREALSWAAARGCTTRWTAGTTSARNIPLGAFTSWAPTGVSDTLTLLRGVIDSLAPADSPAQVVLSVDDAHLLDELSAFVVHQIAARAAATVILTIRDGEPVPAAVEDIWARTHFERLDLAPLDADDTTRLLSEALDGPVDPTAAQRLWDVTGGNGLYLTNIVEQEVADGRLTRQDRCWRWTGELVVPPGLVGLVESRIGALSPSVGEIIDALAVGEPLELGVLQRIGERDAIEEAETRGLITLEPAGAGIEVRLAHPLYGEVRRRSAPRSRLRRLRGAIATELAATGASDDIRIVVRRAALSVESDLEPDAALLVRAAYGAVWLGEMTLADRLADAAVRADAGPEPQFIRAHALSWSGRGAEAEAVFAAIDTDALSDDERGRFAFLRSSNALWALGDPARARSLIDEASGIATETARTYVTAFMTVFWFAMDESAAAVRAAKALTLHDIPVVGAEIAWVLAQISADAGRTGDAVADAAAGHAVAARALDAPQMRFNIADAEVSALLLAGQIADALGVAAETHRQSRDLPGTAQLLGDAVAGRAALGAGDLPTACLLLEHAADGLSASHPDGWGYRYRIPHATVLAMRGRSEEAAAALDALSLVRRRFRMLDHENSLARAWLAASQGAISEAITIARGAGERACAKGQFAAEVLCLQTATQFGDRTTAPRLHQLTGITEGPRAGVAARFARALADGDAAELSAASADFEAIGDLIAALDAAGHAALAYRRLELRGSALSSAARAAALAERCGAVTPALRQAGEPLPLTEREAEIVMLIGEGLSNREVADRLTLSVRTVESHIYRAMAKTGTSGRDELAALLAPPARTQ
ncbi:AAA ATPase domain-containing protein [Mycolicibacterium rutilum]|uniref:AAA ATPase domain-containing protein n=1 Tax=Mycolicibacterium rutilum TaxID=370526 RepID=A0A1H6JWT4_MYCRU|nr:LuxR family transcriptional regulator [Mycolicibacterium rutilum]SEH63513.1 AAA ATPase domain-containing protein [Mycolicibacterium rutilum]